MDISPLRAGKVQSANRRSMIAAFAGSVIFGIMTSILFGKAIDNQSF